MTVFAGPETVICQYRAPWGCLLDKHRGCERGNIDCSLLAVEGGLFHDRVSGVEQRGMQMQVQAGKMRICEVDD
jgi:hypothetical protein